MLLVILRLTVAVQRVKKLHTRHVLFLVLLRLVAGLMNASANIIDHLLVVARMDKRVACSGLTKIDLANKEDERAAGV